MGDTEKPKKPLVIFFVSIAVAIFLIILGIVLICVHIKTTGSKIVIDYTHCYEAIMPDEKCEDKVGPNKNLQCICYLMVNLTEPIIAPVTLYYELPNFDQIRAGYVTSKDDAQLAGKLSVNVSSNCGNYSYDDSPEGKKPIAPCGEIADSMLYDEYKLFYNDSIVPSFVVGLDGITEEDKKLYHNPPNKGDLQAAFKGFVKPKSWPVNVTQLDSSDPGNNGFQNERFIGWMKTDMKRKPAFRIDHREAFEKGLPAGSYKLRVVYLPSKYVTGPRIVILSSEKSVANKGILVAGILLLLIGLSTLCIVGYYKIVYRSYIPCKTEQEK